MKKALVTGGSGGIGSAICRALAEDGWFVYVGGCHHMARAEALAAEIGGEAVSYFADYSDGSKRWADGRSEEMELKDSNVLEFGLADGTKLLVRPSGTEPKVKVYILAKGADAADCADKIARYTEFAESLKK